MNDALAVVTSNFSQVLLSRLGSPHWGTADLAETRNHLADLSDSSGCTIIHSAVMSKISASCFNKVLKMITSLKTYDELVRCAYTNFTSQVIIRQD